jgi:hypothetical protein
LSRRFATIASEALRVLHEANIVALGKGALVFGDTVVPLVAFIIIIIDTALSNILAKLAVERPRLLLGRLTRVLRQRALELAQLLCAPDLWDIFFVFERLDGASYVATDAVRLVPKGAGFVEEIESVVGEEVGRQGQVYDGGPDFGVESVEGGVGCAGVAYNRLWGYL